jgi:shikimate dehydrogenase
LPKEDIHANIVIDLIYNPQKTSLLKFAEELGIKGIGGEIMLKEQAVKAHEIWSA